MPSRLFTLGAVLVALAGAPAVFAQPRPAAPAEVAAFGDLAPYRAITTDIMTLAGKNDLAAAGKRGTDLETAWDNAEDKLKPTDPTRWRVVDKAIDRVLNELRAPKPQQGKVTAAVQDLLAVMDKGNAA